MKLWGGRFEKGTDSLVEDFNGSIHIDHRMYKEDIQGSIAHAEMLGHCGIIEPEEAEEIMASLKGIQIDIEAGNIHFSVADEDIHMNIERLLIERIGETGKKLHTARSRNDQVALDFRLYLKKEIEKITELTIQLMEVLLKKTEENSSVILPGYTHLQKAQPISLGHHFLAYFEMFKRDMDRYEDCKRRMDVMPLGSGALAATTYPIDRLRVASTLGFSKVTLNSIDGVSDRDFAIEFINCCGILMMHLSRFCEELILWSTDEFGFVEMDDAYSTGSSIMPQKKNPDVAELIRGKSGRVFGDLMAMLTVMKGLPLAYNKDMQEDKEITFDAADTVKACLEIFAPMLDTMKIKAENMKKKLRGGFLNATDVADYLVRKGVPFRNAHEIVGLMVNYCIKSGKEIDELDIEELTTFSPLLEEDLYKLIKMEQCVERRNVIGGPGKEQVAYAISAGKAFLNIVSEKK